MVVSNQTTTTMTTELSIAFQHKMIESEITTPYTKRPGFFAGWTLEDKKAFLVLEKKELEAYKVYQDEFNRQYPDGRAPHNADGTFDMRNYPVEASSKCKVANDEKFAFIMAKKNK